MEERRSLQGYLLIFISGVFWGFGGYFVTQMSNIGISSLITAFSGHFLALIPLLFYLLVKKGMKGLKISRKGLFYSILLGVLTKGILRLANDTAIIINLMGCILMVTGGKFTELNVSGLGLTLGVIAGFLYALNTILGKIATSGDDPETMTFYILLFSSITMSIVAKPWQHLEVFTNSTFLFWAFLNAMSTGLIANLLYLKGLSLKVDASKATIIASGEVVIATLSGVFLLKEKINVVGYFGIVIMLISIVLMNITIPIKSKEIIKNDAISSFE